MGDCSPVREWIPLLGKRERFANSPEKLPTVLLPASVHVVLSTKVLSIYVIEDRIARELHAHDCYEQRNVAAKYRKNRETELGELGY